MEVDEAANGQNDAEKMREFRRRFFDFLWNFAVIVDPETSQATSVDARDGNPSNSESINPYRSAPIQRRLACNCAAVRC